LKNDSSQHGHAETRVNRLASGAIDTAKPQHGAEAKPQHGAEANHSKPERRTGESQDIRQTVKELPCNQWSHDIKSPGKEEVSGLENWPV
jgi:hypothetical protein